MRLSHAGGLLGCASRLENLELGIYRGPQPGGSLNPNAAERVTNCRIKYDVVASRSGDPPTLVADAAKANREPKWELERVSIETIVASAWEYHRRQ